MLYILRIVSVKGEIMRSPIKHKVCYLAGGMSGLTLEEANRWRQKIKDLFVDIEPRIHFINPIDHAWFDKVELGLITEKEAMELDLIKLRTADFMIVNFNVPGSIGTAIEMGIATERRIPILGLNEGDQSLHPWQKELSHKVFTKIDNLIAYIVDHFLYDD